MKEFFKENWVWLLLGLVFLLLLAFINMKFETKDMRGTIYEHNTTADRSGNISYWTIIKMEDGKFESKEGLNLYTVEVGKEVYIEVKRVKQ
jgi:hypothetical protein